MSEPTFPRKESMFNTLLADAEKDNESNYILILNTLAKLGLDTRFSSEEGEDGSREEKIETIINSTFKAIVDQQEKSGLEEYSQEERGPSYRIGGKLIAFLIRAKLFRQMCDFETTSILPKFEEVDGHMGNVEQKTLINTLVETFGSIFEDGIGGDSKIKEDLFEIFDAALEESKKNGGNLYSVFMEMLESDQGIDEDFGVQLNLE